MTDRRLSFGRCRKVARRHRVKWFLRLLSADAKINRTPTAGGGPFAIYKPSSGPSAARSRGRRVEPLYDGGRIRETGASRDKHARTSVRDGRCVVRRAL